MGVAATHYLVTAHELHGADPAIAMLISFITIATLLPMTIYTSKGKPLSSEHVVLFVINFFISFWNKIKRRTAIKICMRLTPVLLQTTPSHLLSSLDKCLREASTLDGVLEFR